MNHSAQLDQALQTTLSKGKVKLFSLPQSPDISLYLFDPGVLEGPISHDEAQRIVAEPAYWSFCWASGQVLARYILEHPEHVKGKTVLDFGSGSGVVAVASALAGATRTIVCDIDPNALLAARTNAGVNGVILEELDDFDALSLDVDLIVAADVLYDRDNYPLLEKFKHSAPQILLADSRVKHIPGSDYQKLATYEARTYPDLNEFEEFNLVRIYAWQKSEP